VALILREFTREEQLNPWRKLIGVFLPKRRRLLVADLRLKELMKRIIASYRLLNKPTPGKVINVVMESDVFPRPMRKRQHNCLSFCWQDMILLLIVSHGF